MANRVVGSLRDPNQAGLQYRTRPKSSEKTCGNGAARSAGAGLGETRLHLPLALTAVSSQSVAAKPR